MTRPSAGLIALSGFFTFGAVVAGATIIALLFPGTAWEPMWRLKPEAHAAFLSMGAWAIVLMFVVGIACALSAVGLWMRAPWGRALAVTLLAVNLIGDTINAFVSGDLRNLIGLPIGGALIAYLLSARVRGEFLNT